MMAKSEKSNEQRGWMKLFDIVASLVVVAMVFVALLVHMLSPERSTEPGASERPAAFLVQDASPDGDRRGLQGVSERVFQRR